jgi:hypothetical protein
VRFFDGSSKGWVMNKAVLLGLLLIPGAAWAGDSADKPKANKNDGLVCHTVDETGSRLGGKRVCMTRDEWEATRRAARDETERAQSRQSNLQGDGVMSPP